MSETPKVNYFYIASSKSPKQVLSLKSQNSNSGAHVVIEPKDETNTQHQLWTYDKETKVFKSKLTEFFVMTVKGGNATSGAPIINETYTPGNTTQQWIHSNGTIQLASDSDFVIGLKQGSTIGGTEAVLETDTQKPDSQWHFVPIEA